MHQSANLQFERIVREFAQWRAVPEDERSPAPAWWWGPAFEIRGVQQPMPAEWCSSLQLPDGSSFALGAEVFLHRSPARRRCLGPPIFRARPAISIPPDGIRWRRPSLAAPTISISCHLPSGHRFETMCRQQQARPARARASKEELPWRSCRPTVLRASAQHCSRPPARPTRKPRGRDRLRQRQPGGP